jgi:hypothetical protein
MKKILLVLTLCSVLFFSSANLAVGQIPLIYPIPPFIDKAVFEKWLELKELSAAPTHKVGYGMLYVLGDTGKLYYKDDAGNATDLTAGGGGGVDTSGVPVDNDFAKFTDADTIEGRSYAETRTDLDLEVGTDFNAYDAALTDLSAVATTAGRYIRVDGVDGFEERTVANVLADISAQASDADLDTLATPTNWRLFHSNGANTIIELALGANGEFLKSNGAAAAPTWVAGAVDAFTLKVDAGATADYFGVTGGDGLFRFTANHFTMADGGDFVTFSLADHATARIALGLQIGNDVQAWGAALDTYAGIAPSANVQTLLANVSFAAFMADLSNTAGAGFAWNGQNLTGLNSFYLIEQAEADADIGGSGQIWVDAGAPNTLWFTDEDGTDTQLGAAATFKLKVDAGATEDYFGVAGGDGLFRFTANHFTMADGGNFVTLSLADHATARAALGVEIGADVQAQNAVLTELTNLTDPNADKFPFYNDTTEDIEWSTAIVPIPGGVAIGAAGNAGVMKLQDADGDVYGDQVGVQSGDTIYTVPTAFPGANGSILVCTTGGIKSWSKDLILDTLVVNEIITFDAEYDEGAEGGAFTIDWTNGQKQKVTITGVNLDMSFTDPPGACNLILVIVQGDGDDTIDWTHDTHIGAAGGTAPTLSTGNADVDIVAFYFDGTDYWLSIMSDVDLIT